MGVVIREPWVNLGGRSRSHGSRTQPGLRRRSKTWSSATKLEGGVGVGRWGGGGGGGAR